MRTFATEGIVLKRRNSGEADRLLSIFTSRHGKLWVKAAGVRRITSRRSSHIEPLNISRFFLYAGKGFPIVTEAETVNNFSSIKSDLSKIGYAYHLCELVDGLCAEGQEHPSVYNLLKETLTALSLQSDSEDLAFDFEKKLLQELGFTTPAHSPLSKDTTQFIENILEKRLKSRRLLHRFV